MNGTWLIRDFKGLDQSLKEGEAGFESEFSIGNQAIESLSSMIDKPAAIPEFRSSKCMHDHHTN